MRIFKISIGIICMLIGMWTNCAEIHAGNNQPGTPETNALLTNLKKLAAKGYMFGHQDGTVYGIGWEGDKERSDVKSVCGDYPAVAGFDLGGIEYGGDKSLDSVPFKKIREEVINHYRRGGVITISWHVGNPLTGGSSWDVSNSATVASVLPGGENQAMFLGWLDKVADFLNSLVTVDGVKIPVLFRPWHEHTGHWFWWGQTSCTAEQYKMLWKVMEDRMSEKGVNNVLYVYSPGGNTTNYMERYPGDEYIDILGFDTYQDTGEAEERSFISDFQRNMTFLDEYCKTHDKLYAITETGYEKIPNPKWWTGMLDKAIGNHHPSYVLVWRNAREKGETHYYAPYPGQKSAADFVKFYRNPRTLFLKDIGNLYQ